MLSGLCHRPWFLALGAVVDELAGVFRLVLFPASSSSLSTGSVGPDESSNCSIVMKEVVDTVEVPGWWLARSVCLTSLQICTLYSHHNSFMSKWTHVFWLKSRSLLPKVLVNQSNLSRIRSWCKQSFTKPCQCAIVKSKSITTLLWGSGKSPSKTGIVHCVRVFELMGPQQVLLLTCSRFLKSRAAILFSSETFTENLQIVSLPNEGISQNLWEHHCIDVNKQSLICTNGPILQVTPQL